MFLGPLFIFFALPSMISIFWFLIRIHPQLPSCDPATMLRHLVWFPPLSPLPFRCFHPTPTPPTPLSVHPRVYPLITDLPSSLQSSSVPHRSSGESEWQRNITLCVIPKVNERGESVCEKCELMTTSRGRPLEEEWLHTCQHTLRGVSCERWVGWFVLGGCAWCVTVCSWVTLLRW